MLVIKLRVWMLLYGDELTEFDLNFIDYFFQHGYPKSGKHTDLCCLCHSGVTEWGGIW